MARLFLQIAASDCSLLLFLVFERSQRIRCEAKAEAVRARPAVPFALGNLAAPGSDSGFQLFFLRMLRGKVGPQFMTSGSADLD